MRRLALTLILFAYAFKAYPSEALEISWNAKTHSVDYKLKNDSRVKVRIGSSCGAVYRAIVNGDVRKAGLHSEVWNGYNEESSVEFGFTADLIFEAQAGNDLMPDRLATIVPKTMRAVDIDVAAVEKKDAPFKVAVFAGKKLVKLTYVKTLPVTIDCGAAFLSKDIVTVNVWPSHHRWVAYGSTIAGSELIKSGMGVQLLYCRQAGAYWQVFKRRLDDGVEEQLTHDDGDKSFPALSGDGSLLVYTKNCGQLWLMTMADKKSRRVDFPKPIRRPQWLDDNRTILFSSLDDPYHGDTDLWKLDYITGQTVSVVNRPWFQYDPSYSPDKKKVIFTDGPELYGKDIYALDTTRGVTAQLTENSSEIYDIKAAWLPDGKDIVYLSNKGGSYNLWIMDEFGRNPRPLTDGEAYNDSPSVAADNRTIFFLSDRSGSVNIWRIGRDASGLAQVTFDENDKKDLCLWVGLK